LYFHSIRIAKYVSSPYVLIFLCDDLKQRITIAEVIENDWFKKGYKAPVFEEPDIAIDDVDAVFDQTLVSLMVFLKMQTLASSLFITYMLSYESRTFCSMQHSGNLVVERREEQPVASQNPVTMNAFELISTSQGLNLGTLFEKQMVRLSYSFFLVFFIVLF